MDEIFVPVRDFPRYAVSNHGRVQNVKTGRILKGGKTRGYLTVVLCSVNGNMTCTVHRLVAQHFLPNPDNKREVDHVDGNPMNNYLSNLRWATRGENQRNCKSRSGSSSKYLGITWHKRDNKWQAQIKIEGKRKHLGYFTDEVEAAKVYDAAAREHNGEFARPNFPES